VVTEVVTENFATPKLNGARAHFVALFEDFLSTCSD